MNLIVFAGVLFAVTMVTARRTSLGEKTMQAGGKAEEPGEAMKEAARPASLVEKIMRAADEADEPDEAKRESLYAYAYFTKPDSVCFGGNGASYRGRKTTTHNGRICQNWASQSPNEHDYTPENYPNSDLTSNYCRNPSGSNGIGPWCYTTESNPSDPSVPQPKKRWDTCGIQPCPVDGGCMGTEAVCAAEDKEFEDKRFTWSRPCCSKTQKCRSTTYGAPYRCLWDD